MAPADCRRRQRVGALLRAGSGPGLRSRQRGAAPVVRGAGAAGLPTGGGRHQPLAARPGGNATGPSDAGRSAMDRAGAAFRRAAAGLSGAGPRRSPAKAQGLVLAIFAWGVRRIRLRSVWGGPLRGSIRPPGSKSITNRALVCAALAEGKSMLTGALDSDDTRLMIDGLGATGRGRRARPAGSRRSALPVAADGCRPPRPTSSVGNSGTTVRFLTAVATLGHGRFRLDGIARMRQRPIQDLLDALGQLGADAVSELGTGCPPVVVRAARPAGRPGHGGRRHIQPVPQRPAHGRPGAPRRRSS